MSSRLGTIKGTLHRLSIRLLADQGSDVLVDGTCLVLPDWEGPTILGVHGFLERIRFALEPPTSAGALARIHFSGV
ncbi:hypothetical protein [Hyalangium rubrum]|uniref:Uncharacterized protein n=1 Tax=Hyalangium rubrum TaxID=3103134 RepID=A0ABU5HFY3_9BACT|nr:hypothetical protein [Hyalangium sp. s54d21]MDY7232385.1 hypothetical protein [Hyalangium sp. s54d21]